MKRVLIILLIICLAAGLWIYAAGQHKTPAETLPEEVPAEEAQPEEALVEQTPMEETPVRISPADLKTNIIDEITSYHFGTAGASLKQAAAAVHILQYVTENDFHSLEASLLSEDLNAAWQSLTEEEQETFRENCPEIISLVDRIFAAPEADTGLYNDAGVYDMLQDVLAKEEAKNDWSALSALLSGSPYSDSTAS